jgi:hypothetical protein
VQLKERGRPIGRTEVEETGDSPRETDGRCGKEGGLSAKSDEVDGEVRGDGLMPFELREQRERTALAHRWFKLVGYVEEGVEGGYARGKKLEAFAQILAFIRKLEEQHPL